MPRNSSTLSNEALYLAEYTRPEAIARYISPTAMYVVRNVHARIYQKIIKALMRRRTTGGPFRILEYGCGPGMNLLQIIELLLAEGAYPVSAIGTDFSPGMIGAARREAKNRLGTHLHVVSHFVARNEALTHDLASSLGVPPSDLHDTFDLILGVNTFRYACRLNKERACAMDIFSLLRPGGYSIMIDLNRGLRFVGSRMHDMIMQAEHRYYIPTLRQYTLPFHYAGFIIEESRNFFCFATPHFCGWMPYSMRSRVVSLCRKSIPFWNTCCSPLARHSVVIGNKPIH